jgi:glycosyltransferase involved in cell wall biosynthesis
MRILMPSIVDPREGRGGAWTATRGLIRVLELAWPGLAIECIPVPSRSRAAHRARQLRCLAQGAVGIGLPAKVAFSRFTRIRRRMIASIRSASPDLIILNGSDLLWLVPVIPDNANVLLVAHNIEHELYRAQLAALEERWTWVAKRLKNDLLRLREYEWSGMRKLQRVVFLSTEDRKTATGTCNRLKTFVLPPVFDYLPRPVSDRSPGTLALGMFADFSWWPNQSSLRWFLDEVWPRLETGIELHLAGYGSDIALAGHRPRVHAHGFVSDPREVFRKCDLMIAPIVTGAGVKVKVAEALFNRVPVLATSLALRGLPIDSTAPVQLCDTADEWVAALRMAGARSLAARRVPDEIASRFSPDRHAAPFRAFAEEQVVRNRADEFRYGSRDQVLHNLSLTSNGG